MTEAKWYVVQIKRNAYSLAERNLVRQGFICFQPLVRQTKRRGSQFFDVSRPVFPGYIFVQLIPTNMTWRKINNTVGVAKLLCMNNRPLMVPAGLVESLKENLDVDGCLTESVDFKEGDRIKILSGPFADFVTEIESVEADARVSLLLRLMGQNARISLDLSQISGPSSS